MESSVVRARRGAELLDQVAPRWFNHIDIAELSMESCTRCIIGQLTLMTDLLGPPPRPGELIDYATYSMGLQRLNDVTKYGLDLLDEYGDIEHGFNNDDYDENDHYLEEDVIAQNWLDLGRAWVIEINARRWVMHHAV